jgi:hypothetical protein
VDKVLVCPDVSEFQVPLDRAFTRDFIIFRVAFGAHYLDPHFLTNANAANRLYEEGRLAGALLYVVYTGDPVGAQFQAAWDAIGPGIPEWLTGIMIDVETWRGQSYELSGDHSRAINQLYGLHAHRMGSWDSVIAYGNAGDLAELYPGRDRRCRAIVANYGSTLAYRQVRGGDRSAVLRRPAEVERAAYQRHRIAAGQRTVRPMRPQRVPRLRDRPRSGQAAAAGPAEPAPPPRQRRRRAHSSGASAHRPPRQLAGEPQRGLHAVPQ